jgi:hypothetical protein
MRNANGNRHLRNSWGLITGGFVLGLLLAAVGYSFSPNYMNTATNTHVTDRAPTTGSLPPPAAHP